MEKTFLFFESVVFGPNSDIRDNVPPVINFITDNGDSIYILVNSKETADAAREFFRGRERIFVIVKEGHQDLMDRLRKNRMRELWKRRDVFPVGSRMSELLFAVRSGFIDLIHITCDELERNTKNPFGIYRIIVSETPDGIIHNYKALQ
jgi:hypothetical protein